MVDSKVRLSEQELIVYRKVIGDIREGADKELILARIQKCQEDIQDLKSRYILLGGHLNDLKPYAKDIWNLAKGRWCKDVYELAEHCFGFKKSTTVRMIGVAKRFGDCMTSLKPEYGRYNYSCLCEMLPLTDEQLKFCTPEMTESEIRALKKTCKKDDGALTHQNVDNSKYFPSLLEKHKILDKKNFLLKVVFFLVTKNLKCDLGLKGQKQEKNLTKHRLLMCNTVFFTDSL